MNPFDEDTNPQAFSQILDPSSGQQQAPDLGGMAEVLGQSASDPAQPSIFEQGRQWAQGNPMGAQILLHTFMSMAKGGGRNFADTLGQGVAQGAQAGLMFQADQEQKKGKKAKEEQEQKNKQQELDLRGRQVAVGEEDLSLRKEEAPLNRKHKQAATAALEQQTQVQGQLAPLERQQIQARIAQLQQSLAESKDAIQTNSIRRQLIALQVVEQGLTNEGKGLENTKERQFQDDMSGLTSQERLALRQGSSAKVKTEDDKILEFANKNLELFSDGAGKVNVPAAREAYYKIVGKQTPEAAAAAQAAAKMSPAEKLAWDKARGAVPVGKPYRGPDGKLYTRKN